MCGIVGIQGVDEVAHDLVLGLTCLQHRGQDAAGIVTFSDKFHLKKEKGLVASIFDEETLVEMKGNFGLGHVRYATQGDAGVHNAQPFYMNYPFGIAMIHNGNITNFSTLASRLRDSHRLVETSNDLELILYTFASMLEKCNLDNVTVDDIFDCVAETQKLCEGAYAVLSVVAGKGLLAFTDPNGIRPLVLGVRQKAEGSEHAFASESTCLESLGFTVLRQLEAGEAVFVDTQGEVHSRFLTKHGRAFCVFEYIYFAREDSTFASGLVAEVRARMGNLLARKFRERGLSPDVVIDVPSTSFYAAFGLAEALNVPYRRAFARNKYVGRSFIKPTQEARESAVRVKLKTIRPYVEGKRVAVVDDSIVRGTTSKRIVSLLRENGAKAVYFVSAAPPVRHPCVYGIDMSLSTELVASGKSDEEISNLIGADAVVYQDQKDLETLFAERSLCTACFSGKYPTNLTTEVLSDIARDKEQCRKS